MNNGKETSGVGKVAVITGAGSGIGRAVALAMHSAGYSVALAGRRMERLEETAALAGGGARVLPVKTDIGQPDSVKELFARVRETFSRVDVLFNNAGASALGVPFEELSYAQWMEVVNANLTGPFLCAQEAVRLMKAQQPRGGRIINNGSLSAHVPRPHSAPYTATKHGLTGLTKCISLDGRAYDIACGQIDLGNAVTEMSESLAVGALQPNGSIMPEPRMDLKPVVEAVMYMASLPLEVNVQFISVMATKMPFIGRG